MRVYTSERNYKSALLNRLQYHNRDKFDEQVAENGVTNIIHCYFPWSSNTCRFPRVCLYYALIAGAVLLCAGFDPDLPPLASHPFRDYRQWQVCVYVCVCVCVCVCCIQKP